MSLNPVAYTRVEINSGWSGGQIVIHYVGVLTEESVISIEWAEHVRQYHWLRAVRRRTGKMKVYGK